MSHVGTTIQETMREIEEFKVEILDWVKHEYYKFFSGVEGFEHEFEGLSVEWDKYTTCQIAKLNVALEVVQKKREEVESLRDGVSRSSTFIPS